MSHATAPIPVLPFTSSLLSYTEQSFGAAPMDTAAIAHQPPGRSVAVPFLRSPLQLMENGFPSVNLSLWCTEKVTWC